MNEVAAQKLASATVATSSAIGAWIAEAKAMAVELLGIPLPVLLMSFVGGFGARLWVPQVTFWSGLGGSFLWSLAGAGLAHLAAWLVAVVISAGHAPENVLGGLAMVLAAAGVVVGHRLPSIANAALDSIKRRLNGDR